MNNLPQSSQKYRPYFTLDELKLLSYAVKFTKLSAEVDPVKTPPHELIRYIDSYILGVEAGVRSPNLRLNPSASIEAKLGFTTSTPPVFKDASRSGEEVYKIWQNNGVISPAEMLILQEYKYTNDLMSPEQEKDYERANGISFG